jgi:hypothetical protein
MNLLHAASCHRLVAVLLGGMLTASLPGSASAQQPPGPGLPQPRLLVVQPAGGKAGTTVDVTLVGIYLDRPQKLLFSHPAIQAEVVEGPTGKPIQPPQGNQPALVAAKFKVTIPADVPVGHCDVRFAGKAGISNPRSFVIGDLPEAMEKEPNNDVAEAQEIPLDSTVHGAITTPTDVDYFRFSGRKGQRVVVSCLTSSIDSKLNALVELYATSGKKLGSNHHYRDGDALLDATLPDDGDYLVRVCSFAYLQGTIDYFYRLTVSTAPWIDAIFPPVVEPGKETTVTVYGRNLPGGKPDPDAVVDRRVLETLSVTVNPPTRKVALQRLAYRDRVAPVSGVMDGFEYRLHNKVGMSNPFLLTFAQAPVVLDNAENGTPEKAQSIEIPCEIAGRIQKTRDRDWYRFSAEKGDVLSIEIYGDRLGSPLDLYAVLKSAAARGGTIAELDDNPDQVPPQFYSRGNDPAPYLFKVPADGAYLLLVSSREAENDAGPRHLYRVRITKAMPDFRVVLMPPAVNVPDACNLRRGATQYCMVFVTRIDGFNGPIILTADGLPEGVSCPKQTIPAGQKQGVLVFTAEAGAPFWEGEIRVKATATIDDETVEREARSATITWPLPQNQITPAISRLDRGLVLAVIEEGPFTLSTELTTATAKPGGKVKVPLKVTRNWPDFKAPVQVTVLGLPGNPQQQPTVTIAPGTTEAEATVDVRQNVPPGVYTLVFRGQAQFQHSTDPAGKQKQNVTVVLPSPPVTLTVVKEGK